MIPPAFSCKKTGAGRSHIYKLRIGQYGERTRADVRRSLAAVIIHIHSLSTCPQTRLPQRQYKFPLANSHLF